MPFFSSLGIAYLIYFLNLWTIDRNRCAPLWQKQTDYWIFCISICLGIMTNLYSKISSSKISAILIHIEGMGSVRKPIEQEVELILSRSSCYILRFSSYSNCTSRNKRRDMICWFEESRHPSQVCKIWINISSRKYFNISPKWSIPTTKNAFYQFWMIYYFLIWNSLHFWMAFFQKNGSWIVMIDLIYRHIRYTID